MARADTPSSPSAHPGERLAKRIARAGICSRREAEALIEAGRVKLDGKIIKTPAINVTESSLIVVDGKPLPAEEPTRLWLYHKPAGLVTSRKDEKDRPTVFDRLPNDMPRVVSVGRLDLNSEGLLLLTNDGELSRHLELPATGWRRRYRARIYGDITPKMLIALKEGATVDGFRYGAVEVILEDEKPTPNKWVSVTLTEGKNREIRKLFEHFGCQVSRLIRTAYGPFQLGAIPRGGVKEVPAKAFKNALGNWRKEG